MSKQEDQNVRISVQEAVKNIGKVSSGGWHYASKQAYESTSYGDLTILTLSEPKKNK